jgi:hypothetical protein
MNQIYSKTHQPGDQFNIYATNASGNEIVIKTNSGLEIRFNLTVGNSVRIIAGNDGMAIDLHAFNNDLVGVPNPD